MLKIDFFNYSFQDGVASEPLFDFQLDPVLSAAVMVATAGLLGVIIGVILVQKGFNRKRILLFSGFGTAVAFFVLGLHFHYNSTGNKSFNLIDLGSFLSYFSDTASNANLITHLLFTCVSESSLLVPTLSLTSHILMFNMGYGSLGYPAMAEMLPLDMRVKGLTFIQVRFCRVLN